MNNRFIIFCLWFAACARLLFSNLNSFALYIVIPMMFLYCLSKSPKLLRSQYMILYSGVMFVSFLSCFIAADTDLAFSSLKTIIGGWMVCFVMFVMMQECHNRTKSIMLTYFLLLATTIYYLWGTGELTNTDIETSRLDESSVNANDIAYLLFFVSTCTTIMIYETGRLGRYTLGLIYGWLITLSIWCSLITASRQILLVVIPIILAGLLFSLTNYKIKIKSIVVLLLGAVVVFYVYNLIVAPLIGNSYLGTRMNEDAKEDIRLILMAEGFSVGLENWFLGVGAGNFINYSAFHAFSHCSYSEIFANSGIFALVLYVSLLGYFIKRQYRFYAETRDSIFKFTFVLGIAWALYNFLYVFYTGPWLIGYFFLIAGYSERKYKELKYGYER